MSLFTSIQLFNNVNNNVIVVVIMSFVPVAQDEVTQYYPSYSKLHQVILQVLRVVTEKKFYVHTMFIFNLNDLFFTL